MYNPYTIKVNVFSLSCSVDILLPQLCLFDQDLVLTNQRVVTVIQPFS